MSLTILSPKLLSIKNRWRHKDSLKNNFGRDSVIAAFSFGVMLSIFWGLRMVLSKVSTDTAAAYLPPSMILDILLIFLYGLLFFSNAVSAIGTLFLSADYGILKAAPISRIEIFTAKLIETVASSTWMVVVFGLPGLIAFHFSYKASVSFVAIALVNLIPYFIIPAALSIVVVTLVAAIVPVNRTKEIFGICGIITLVGAYFLLDLLFNTASKPMQGIEDILYLVDAIRAPNEPWLPSHWVAVVLGSALRPSGLDTWPHIIALWSTMMAVLSLAYLTFLLLHDRAYSMAQASLIGKKEPSQFSITNYPPISWIYNQQERALLGREMSTFLRDFSQSIQLMLLLGLCSFYLYNLRLLRVIDNLPVEASQWWQSFLVIGNLGMGTFVLAAICTRFVFPSVSLEGKSYWILKSSPVPLKSILRAKFKIWYIPISIVGSTLLLSGAMAIQAEPQILFLSATVCWITTIGIIGLAMGFGSFYANFEWEHASQLASTFGSLVYMLGCAILIVLNMLPISLLLIGKYFYFMDTDTNAWSWSIGVFFTYLLLYNINRAIYRWSLKIGERSLSQRDH